MYRLLHRPQMYVLMYAMTSTYISSKQMGSLTIHLATQTTYQV